MCLLVQAFKNTFYSTFTILSNHVPVIKFLFTFLVLLYDIFTKWFPCSSSFVFLGAGVVCFKQSFQKLEYVHISACTVVPQGVLSVFWNKCSSVILSFRVLVLTASLKAVGQDEAFLESVRLLCLCIDPLFFLSDCVRDSCLLSNFKSTKVLEKMTLNHTAQ